MSNNSNILVDEHGQPLPQIIKTADGGDSAKDTGVYKHDLSIPEHKKNFDQKIYMFPESYNQLRKELVENWPTLWLGVGWYMAFKAEDFVSIMNDALEMRIQFDTEKVGWICEQFLTALRKKRGFSQ